MCTHLIDPPSYNGQKCADFRLCLHDCLLFAFLQQEKGDRKSQKQNRFGSHSGCASVQVALSVNSISYSLRDLKPFGEIFPSEYVKIFPDFL